MITGVHLVTGLIGSGKTLRAVSLIKQEVATGRAVFVCNINGLNIPGVIPFDDPKRWQELPPGSLLVVDEAQRYWRSRRTAEVPDELQAMETSRHDAVSFLILTQQPTYLDKHLRGLVGRHDHLYRRMGLQSAQMFTWERCAEDPMSIGEKDAADKSVFVYKKEDFASYKSADEHTVKVKIGTRMKLVAAAAVLVLACIGWIAWQLNSDGAGEGAAVASSGLPAQPANRSASVAHLSHMDYFARLVPRSPTMPWSAPAYDGNRVASKPEVACMSSGLDGSESCKCMTEQGTLYALEEASCRLIARHGPTYNPFKPPPRQDRLDRDRADQRDDDVHGRDAAMGGSVIGGAQQVSSYGAIAAGVADALPVAP